MPIVGAGVALVVNVLMARVFGPEGRGHVALFLQIASLISPALLLGADRMILRTREYPPTGTSPSRHVLLLALSASLMIMVAAPGDIWAAAVAVSAGACLLELRRSEAIRDSTVLHYVGPALCYHATVMAGSVLLYTLNVHDWRTWTIPYLLVPALLIVGDLAGWLRRRSLALSVTRESLALAPFGLANLFASRSDRLLLGLLQPPRELGLYVVVATAAEPLLWLTRAAADTRSSEGRLPTGRGATLSDNVKAAATYGATAGLAALTLRWAIVPVFGGEYRESAALALPLCVAAALACLYQRNMATFLVRLPAGAYSSMEIARAATFVLLGLTLIPGHGAEGAAASAVAAGIVGYAASLVLVLATAKEASL